MKKITGYYATQRRHGRARAVESPVRRAGRTGGAPGRYGQQTHAVGSRSRPGLHLLWIAAALVATAVLASRMRTPRTSGE